jgi:hypothetical protein
MFPYLIPVTIGRVKVGLEVASDPDSRAIGLSGRTALGEDSGMFFVFDQPGIYRFTMVNTFIPLDIAYVNVGGIIIGMDRMYPMASRLFGPLSPIRYAIEMNAGWFTRNNIRIGDTIRIGGLSVLPD